MMGVFDLYYKLAHKLIQKYGYNKVDYVQQVKVENNIWNDEFSQKVRKVNAVILPSDKYSRETFRLQNEKNIIDSNYIAFMPYSGFVPNINDLIRTNTYTHTILSVKELAPNGEKVLYKLELK